MIPWNRVKIIGTIGPATSNYKIIKKLIMSGLDIVRINFSHGEFSEYKKTISIVRKIEKEIDRPIGILADIPGPKLRIKNFKQELEVKTGDLITINKNNISYPIIIKYLIKHSTIFISDGKIKLKVIKSNPDSALCKVHSGGTIKNGAGLNFPDIDLPIPSVTSQDFKYIEFAMKADIDFIGLSFIKDSKDLTKVRNFLKNIGKKSFLIAKIERRAAIKNLNEIIKSADGLMVARGDLGVEMPIEKITILQKEIIKKCNNSGKPVITATQMLESMIYSPSPTRAEVSDIANAILDGTDAIMLSGETAVGKYPVKSVEMMAKVAKNVERNYPFNKVVPIKDNLLDIISSSVSNISVSCKAKTIVIPTLSGNTARMVSRYRPDSMIIALTVDKKVQRQLTISWGVFPYLTSKYKKTESILKKVDMFIKSSSLFEKGDKIIIAAGTLDKKGNLSNIIKITRIIK
ncbi:MAG: pyruvate kinase [Candidatus Firestonebacteria bacterium]